MNKQIPLEIFSFNGDARKILMHLYEHGSTREPDLAKALRIPLYEIQAYARPALERVQFVRIAGDTWECLLSGDDSEEADRAARRNRRVGRERLIFDYLVRQSEGRSWQAIANALGMEKREATRALSSLKVDGKAMCISRGKSGPKVWFALKKEGVFS